MNAKIKSLSHLHFGFHQKSKHLLKVKQSEVGF